MKNLAQNTPSCHIEDLLPGGGCCGGGCCGGDDDCCKG